MNIEDVVRSSVVPKLSIVLPIFNGREFMRESLSAILGQDFYDFELIVVDDASSDDSWEIIADFASRESRIRPFRLEVNTRKNGAFALGLSEARSDLVMEANADDVLLPSAISTLMSTYESNPDAGMVFGNHDVIRASGEIDAALSRIWDERSSRGSLQAGFVDNLMAVQSQRSVLTTSVCAIFKKSLVGNFPSFTHTMTDYWVSWKIASSGTAYYVPQVLAHYRRHETSDSGSWNYYSRAMAMARLQMNLAILLSASSHGIRHETAVRIVRSMVTLLGGAALVRVIRKITSRDHL